MGDQDPPGLDGQAVDGPRGVVRRQFNGADAELFELFKKDKRQANRIHKRRVHIHHHQRTVNVQAIAGDVNADEFDAVNSQHLLKLARTFFVATA